MSENPSNETESGGGGGAAPELSPSPSGRGVLCAKCEHLNPEGLEKCETCQAHLFIFCSYCGSKNGRVLARCRKCRRRLKDGLRRRLRDREKGPVNLIYIGIGIVVAVAAAVAVVKLMGVRLWS